MLIFGGLFSLGSATKSMNEMQARRNPSLVSMVQQMAQGRQDGLGLLYDETAPLVNGLLMRILKHPQDAEEVLMDVYMKAWKNAASYSPDRGCVQSWLVMMARSVAIDRMRQRKTRFEAAGLALENAPEPISNEASPEEQMVRGQWRARVRNVLDELPAEQREAVVMAFFGGLSHSELAERLGQPLGTVKTRIRAGLVRLRNLLNEPATV
jgi:RNA polymerase sigma-70 factor (ECF subfamily)